MRMILKGKTQQTVKVCQSLRSMGSYYHQSYFHALSYGCNCAGTGYTLLNRSAARAKVWASFAKQKRSTLLSSGVR